MTAFRRNRIALFFMAAVLAGCRNLPDSPVSNFNLFCTQLSVGDTLEVEMPLQEAAVKGIALPAHDQSYPFSFTLTNPTDSPTTFYYKIYYQNESHKLPEALFTRSDTTDENGQVVEIPHLNPDAERNFYGSWAMTETGFKSAGKLEKGGSVQLKDSIRIVGNPRNESRYFGANSVEGYVSEEDIHDLRTEATRNPVWSRKISEKAKENSISFEAQLWQEISWALRNRRAKGDHNNRWKRNPRTGAYNFILVVATEAGLGQIPAHLQDIAQTDPGSGRFENPFYRFRAAKDQLPEGVWVFEAPQVLKTHAVFDLESGIFVDRLNYPVHEYDSTCVSRQCGETEDLYKNAQFAQYFHSIQPEYDFYNVGRAADVAGGEYSHMDYMMDIAARSGGPAPVHDLFHITDCPCQTVSLAENQGINIINPGNDKGPEFWEKENTGVRARIGFTYGKFRAKIHFPKILSDENIWNGLTCAYWLIAQEDQPWNNLGPCDSAGYIPKYGAQSKDERHRFQPYSEIDIEIVKTSKYWPQTSYQGSYVPVDSPANNRNLIAACTNWDLACPEPNNFNIGAQVWDTPYGNWEVHRWDNWYKALTAKQEIAHDDLVGRPLWYEIDWEPDRIIWRVGPELDQLRIIGYMDTTITMIPDNQMVPIITQEFHHAEWWPLAPFPQNQIPFPSKDLVGKVLEVRID